MSRKKSKKPVELSGRIDITRSGMGYVIVEGLEDDILVRPQNFNHAFDGDVVQVRIKQERNKRHTEGVVSDIIQRKQTKFIGRIEGSEKFAFFIASSNKPMPDFYIRKDNLNGARNGDTVMAEFVKWDKDDRKPEAKVISVLDAGDDVDIAMKETIIEHGFSIEFPEEINKEADELNGAITEQELMTRRDFRDIFTITIDPVDAKDFDDAISLQKLDNGEFEIGVHIADVSHFLKEGTKLDAEAYDRANSVYLPDRVVPMLPERISNFLCSLRPGEEKYCFSAVFVFTDKLKIRDSWFGKTVINSNRRFNYDEVQQVIETGKGDCLEEITKLNTVAKFLRKERFKKGAINFSSSEVKFLLDAEGRPRGIVLKESKESHQLIEEFMLLANREVANLVSKTKLKKEAIPFPYRIHDEPDEEKLKPYIAFAKKFGYEFDMKNARTIANSFNRLLETVKGKPEQIVLEQLGIRTMAKAAYSTKNIGHYGLAFKNYCHFTSPIRRYPDVMTHRILFSILKHHVHPDDQMEKKCVHCSERERAAIEAERDANKYEQVLFMKDKVGEEMDGVISGVASFGFWVETIEEKCEGLVSVRDLSYYDDFTLNEELFALTGKRSGRQFRMGDPVHVKLVAANLDKRQLDFEWAPPSPEKKEKSKKTKTRTAVKKKKKA